MIIADVPPARPGPETGAGRLSPTPVPAKRTDGARLMTP